MEEMLIGFQILRIENSGGLASVEYGGNLTLTASDGKFHPAMAINNVRCFSYLFNSFGRCVSGSVFYL